MESSGRKLKNGKGFPDAEKPAFFRKIREHRPGIIGEREIFRSAVCIPLLKSAEGYHVLFEVRSRRIPDQPGDICLPGGRMEPGESPEETALRELCEELLISGEQANLIGPNDIFHNGNLIIYPYVVLLSDYRNTFHEAEVESVFTVPLQYFKETEPEAFCVGSVVTPGEDFPYDRINGGRNYRWRGRSSVELFYQYEGHWIWGITARIMRAFAEGFL